MGVGRLHAERPFATRRRERLGCTPCWKRASTHRRSGRPRPPRSTGPATPAIALCVAHKKAGRHPSDGAPLEERERDFTKMISVLRVFLGQRSEEFHAFLGVGRLRHPPSRASDRVFADSDAWKQPPKEGFRVTCFAGRHPVSQVGREAQRSGAPPFHRCREAISASAVGGISRRDGTGRPAGRSASRPRRRSA